MYQLHIPISVLLFLYASLFETKHINVAEHNINCPEDMYGKDYLKYYNMTAFLTTWTTTTPNESITIPTIGGGYFYDVAWGDGSISTNQTGNATHIYSNAGTYQVSITGSFPRIYFNVSLDRNKIQSVDQWGNQPWISMANAFFGCMNLEVLASDAPNLANVLDMSNMFRLCENLDQNLNNWNVSNVTDMSMLFQHAGNPNISNWDVGNVENMSQMFVASPINHDLSSWDVSNVTNMKLMFKFSSYNQDISSWDVSNVTNMRQMFASSQFNQDISSWDVSNVTDMTGMFYDSQFNKDISSWDVSSVTNMRGMFEISQFNQDISSWNVSNVVSMKKMFRFSPFNQDIGSWDVSKVTTMESMFTTSPFNQDISSWDVSNVVDMRSMFWDSAFNQDISSWDVSNVVDMRSMFSFSPFNQDLSDWDISNGPMMSSMFESLTTENYDKILIAWVQQSPLPTSLGVKNTQYCAGAAAKDMLINTYGWNITDGGQASTISIDNSFTNANGTNMWTEGGNWSLGIVPTSIHSVIIPSGFTAILPNWTSQFDDGICYDIEIQSNAVFKVEDNATFKTTIPCNY